MTFITHQVAQSGGKKKQTYFWIEKIIKHPLLTCQAQILIYLETRRISVIFSYHIKEKDYNYYGVYRQPLPCLPRAH
jgi:hypothetical protein